MRKRLNRFFSALLVIAATVGVAVCYRLSLPQGAAWQVYAISALLVITGFFVGWFVHALLHEIGHLIFGTLAGFRLREFSVGPFHFLKTGKRTKFYCKRDGFAGKVAMVSLRSDNLPRRYFALTFGGVFASLLSGIAAVLVVALCREMNFYLYSALLAVALSGVYLFSVNAFAFENGGVYSDGAVLSGIRRKDPQVLLWLSLAVIQGMLAAGRSPRDLDRNYFYGLPLAGNPSDVQILDCRYFYELDCGNLETAVRISDEIAGMFSDLPEIFREGALTDVFYTELALKKDLKRAAGLWKQIEEPILRDPNICNLRVLAAKQLYLDEDPRLALETARRALAVKEDFPLPGIAEMEERLIREVCAQAEEALRSEGRDDHE